MDQQPVQIGQYVLGKNLGIGAFGKVSSSARFCSKSSILPMQLRTETQPVLHPFPWQPLYQSF